VAVDNRSQGPIDFETNAPAEASTGKHRIPSSKKKQISSSANQVSLRARTTGNLSHGMMKVVAETSSDERQARGMLEPISLAIFETSHVIPAA
jgi:hypothetical protein